MLSDHDDYGLVIGIADHVRSALTRISLVITYWDIFDPTNGYTAISCVVAARLTKVAIDSRYFFETDVLFRLTTMRAVVADVPMHALYRDEVSGLKIGGVVGEFFVTHVRSLFKRIFHRYYLRDFPAASLELLAGSLLLVFGIAFSAAFAGGSRFAPASERPSGR